MKRSWEEQRNESTNQPLNTTRINTDDRPSAPLYPCDEELVTVTTIRLSFVHPRVHISFWQEIAIREQRNCKIESAVSRTTENNVATLRELQSAKHRTTCCLAQDASGIRAS